MQLQPGLLHKPRHGESRRARQASNISEDAFKGGLSSTNAKRALLRSPWLSGTGRLWPAEMRRRDSAEI